MLLRTMVVLLRFGGGYQAKDAGGDRADPKEASHALLKQLGGPW